MEKVELSMKERLDLRLHFRTLERVDPKSADHWDQLAQIVEHGFESEYEKLMHGIVEPTPEHVCREVRDVMAMYLRLQESYEDLGGPAEISSGKVRFRGFDGNYEPDHFGYANFVRDDLGQFKMLEIVGNGLNSHAPTLWKYRPMLREWKRLDKEFAPLTVAEIRRVLDAGDGKADPYASVADSVGEGES